jgi:hypothetical protein
MYFFLLLKALQRIADQQEVMLRCDVNQLASFIDRSRLRVTFTPTSNPLKRNNEEIVTIMITNIVDR